MSENACFAHRRAKKEVAVSGEARFTHRRQREVVYGQTRGSVGERSPTRGVAMGRLSINDICKIGCVFRRNRLLLKY